MKTKIPDELKAGLPANKWGKTLSVTPVVMTVIATLLAGLASSEMTRAQYDRSLAAQQQSKAGDQWNFFQAKKLRAALQHNTLDLVANTADVPPLDPAALSARLAGTPAQDVLATPAGQQALALLRGGEPPKLPPARAPDPTVQAALHALDAAQSDEEVIALVEKVPLPALEAALRDAQDLALANDVATGPVSQAVDLFEKQLARPDAGLAASAPLRRSFTAARLAYNAQRYDAEARLNQAIASLRELQVRKSNLSAERHHLRSQRFFFGMLAAQLGVIVSTLAMAARQRNLLWGIAAAAGAIAVCFALYVYLWV